MFDWLIACKEWIAENEKWAVPILVALLSLIGATLGGWWSGRKRIGIEVLSRNRQEWLNTLRVKTSELLSDLFYLNDLFYEITLLNQMKMSNDNLAIKNKELLIELMELYSKITSQLFFLQLLLSPNKNIIKTQTKINCILLYFPILFRQRNLKIKSNECMIELYNLCNTLHNDFIDKLVLKFESILILNSPAEPDNTEDKNKSLQYLRENIRTNINVLQEKVEGLIYIEWRRIKKTI